MKTVWVGKSVERNYKSSLRMLLQYLLVDVVPVILLLAAMACGMAFVSHKFAEPKSIEVKVAAEHLG